MMLSLLETILVMYLMEKDSASQEDETDINQSVGESSGDKPGRAINLRSCEGGEIHRREKIRGISYNVIIYTVIP